MATRAAQHEARLEKWKKQIEECRGSGKRVSEWCSEHGVSPKTYRRWERELYGVNSENRSSQKRVRKPEAAAAWLSSFLGQSAMLLMHDDGLWGMVDAWLAGLSDNQFTAVLPMLRRTFTGFSAPERRQLAERARRAPRSSASAPAGKDAWDEARAVLPLPLLRRMLGLAAEPEAGR